MIVVLFKLMLSLACFGVLTAQASETLWSKEAPNGLVYTDSVIAQRINELRAAAGLPEQIYAFPRLIEQATYSACYQAKTGEFGYTQSLPESVCYTGETLEDRTPGKYLVIDEITGSTTAESFDSLLAAFVGSVYHRVPLLNPDLDSLGVGVAREDGRNVLTVLTAQKLPTTGRGGIITLPYSGQKEVPLAYMSDAEFPDPFAEYGLMGYPISVHVSKDVDFEVQSLKLYQKGVFSAQEVPGKIAPDSDKQTLRKHRAVAFVPLKPLEPLTTYQVEVAGLLSGEKQTIGFEFTTQAN